MCACVCTFTSRLAHGDRLDEVLRSHVELALVLHGAEETETVLMGGQVHVSIVQIIRLSL